MKRILAISALGLITCGCTKFWGGAATGAVGTGAAYEINARKQLDKLDADLKAGRIDQKEYEARRDQIKKGSVVY
jgi:hypothetical protein